MVASDRRAKNSYYLSRKEQWLYCVCYEVTHKKTPEGAVYGLKGRETQGALSETELDDISADHLFVCRICELLNRNSVSLIHMKDVVYDLLCEKFSILP